MTRRQEGYTLVELVVVMGVFAVVMAIISVSFSRIVSSSTQTSKSAETEIGGLIGLELFRLDLGLAGLGLPWSLPSGFTYDEAPSYVLVGDADSFSRADASLFNDTTPQASLPPRAIVLGDNVGYNGSDYLVLKGTPLGGNSVCQSWSFLSYSSNSPVIKPSKSELELTPGQHARVMVVRTGVSGGVPMRELVTSGNTSFTLWFDEPLQKEYCPRSREDNYLVYGIASEGKDSQDKDGNTTRAPLNFPFNRSDYFLSRPSDISANCAPHTALLYKTTINQNGSWVSRLSDRFTWYPLLDCVADLQVMLLLDTNGDGDADMAVSDLKGLTAEQIRAQVKEVRVYILAQQGKKDPQYTYPGSRIFVGDPKYDAVKFPNLGSVWDGSRLASTFGPDWMHYHWKLYTIAVQPKNLN